MTTRTNVSCSAAKCSLAGLQRRSSWIPAHRREHFGACRLFEQSRRSSHFEIYHECQDHRSHFSYVCPVWCTVFFTKQTTDRNLCQENSRHFFVCMVLNIVRLRRYGRPLMETLNAKIVSYLNVYRLHTQRRKKGVQK